MPTLAPEEAKQVDAALSEWRQGDVALDEKWFVHVGDPAMALSDAAAAAGDDGPQAIMSEVAGLVVITQTCDVVRVRDTDCASGSCEVLPSGNSACTGVCGNGVAEPGEACDDGNVLACGTCNATCTDDNPVVTGCANGTACASDDDCTSDNCNGANVCAP